MRNALSISAERPWPINGTTCSHERAQAILDESSVRRARKILGRINQHAVSIKRGIVSLGGFLPGVSEQLLDELVFE